MNNTTRIKLIKLLVACVVMLLCAVSVVTFSGGEILPTWTDIGSALFGGQSYESPDDFVSFIDVGQGDSILISSNGYNALIDFGVQDNDKTDLVGRLKQYGVDSLDCIVATHYDSDHIGAGPEVISAFRVDNAVIPELDDRDTATYDNFQRALTGSGANVYTAKLGTIINIGDFELTVIGYYYDEKDSNDRSIVIMADIDGIKFLLTGDAGEDVEKNLIDDRILLDCDVLKASHHGSRNSNSEAFIRAASPDYVVISVGNGNSYGHPHEEVLEIFEEENIDVLRTDLSGDIVFYVDSGRLSVKTEY